MHGLIFVTWEKFLGERFGSTLLNMYRATIGETPATSPLTSRVYDDKTLLAGVGAACQLTGISADLILREYGHYFMINGLTSHLCAYLLAQVHNGHEIFALIYDSPRQLCPVLLGAIEGAAERYGEKVKVAERTCMKRGAAVCRFEMRFFSLPATQRWQQETLEQQARRRAQQQLANLVLSTLPDTDGVMLTELQGILLDWQISPSQLRPSVLLEALNHLVHAGLVSSTANQPGDNLTLRRYWRAPTWGNIQDDIVSAHLKR